MRLINVETLELETFLDNDVPPYNILSHTWGAASEEISFDDLQKRRLDKLGGVGMAKLLGCCKQTKADGLAYAWIDTCCINKDSSKELEEAINSMFRWYKDSAICYAYLADVPGGGDAASENLSAFSNSRWFTRGWTLQELLAPADVQFFNADWRMMGSKGDLSNEIEDVTRIPRRFLLGWEEFSQASVAQRMSWAAKRVTSRVEDIAYCLLGIFDVTMSMIYGEGTRAFIRLQHEIMRITADQSILAWGLNRTSIIYTRDPSRIPPPFPPSGVTSAGILAFSPSPFSHSGLVVRRHRQASAPHNPFDTSIGRLLGLHTCLYERFDGRTYALIDCVMQDMDSKAENGIFVLGIPLYKLSAGEYLRPHHSSPILVYLGCLEPKLTYERIYIQMARQDASEFSKSQRRLWLHIDGLQKMGLKLHECVPELEWTRNRALVAELGVDGDEGGQDETVTHRHLVRFRSLFEDLEAPDIIALLEFDVTGAAQTTLRIHTMTLSRSNPTRPLLQVLSHVRPQALGRVQVCNRKTSVALAYKKEQVNQDPIILLRVVKPPHPVTDSINGDLELTQAITKSMFIKTLDREREVDSLVKGLHRQHDERLLNLDTMAEKLKRIEKQLRILSMQRDALTASIKKEEAIVGHARAREVDLTEEQCQVRLSRMKLGKAISEYERKYGLQEGADGAGMNWVEEQLSSRGFPDGADDAAQDWVEEQLSARGMIVEDYSSTP